MKFAATLLCGILISALIFNACQKSYSSKSESFTSKVALDQEIKVSENKVINSSTQSLNRYASNLRDLESVKLDHRMNEKKLNFTLENIEKEEFLEIKNIDIQYICPQLPYQDVKQDKFDIANLILAEYSRNGIGIPVQKSNNLYAQVEYTDKLFNDQGEYIYENNKYQPNPGVIPKRLSVINNCLRPGLWEFSATDAVGEMYHSWFEVDRDFYFEIIANQTGISQDNIPIDFNDPIHFKDVTIDLERLRKEDESLGSFSLNYNDEKDLGAYSNQDSRRKVQRKFFNIERNSSIIEIKQQAELKDGDQFSMFSFQEPGIYDPHTRMKTEFKRTWAKAEIYRVSPRTSYIGQKEFLPSKYFEIRILDSNDQEALILGNIPTSLLSFRNDFVIPAFGVGVFIASEAIERRYLRTTVGPHPSYAYLAKIENQQFQMVNNHDLGYEQIYIRPVMKGDDIVLRITLVSYERITDLIEFEINVNDLKEEFLKNDRNYKPPIFETYQDDNTF